MPMKQMQEYPQPAMLSDGTSVTAMNEKLRAMFPDWREGGELPGPLRTPEELSGWESCMALDGRMYSVRCERSGEQWIYFFQQAPQRALTEAQLDGALHEIRRLSGQFYRQLSPCVAEENAVFPLQNKEAFSKSYYCMLRLMDHLDFLRDAQGDGVRLDRQELELDRFCTQLALECGGLLQEIGIRIDYTGLPMPVYVAADEGQLCTAVLELVSNCAKRLKNGGNISLRLLRRGQQAMLCIADDGPPPTQAARSTSALIPSPDAGAGLGLSVAREILRLHGGAVLIALEGDTYLSLPTVRPSGRLTFRSPRMERNAGMSPYIIALADVLPGKVVREDWKP